MKKHLITTALLGSLTVAPKLAWGGEMKIEPMDFETSNGVKIEDAEWGEFEVPLYHDDPSKGSITMSFVRFPSTSENPGPPLVYLAGGPGGVGMEFAAGFRHPLFMALRERGDVIAFNQRGTGPTSGLEACPYNEKFDGELVVNRDNFIGYYQRMAAHCNDYWKANNVEIGAYNTWESAGDLEALRKGLGVEKLDLWGISYGTHLTLAALKRNPDSYRKVVMVSPEGLDQTVKMPARSDKYFERVQEMIDNHPELSQAYGDFVPALRRVINKLREEPVTVTIQPEGLDAPVTMTFDHFPVQGLISFGFISDPRRLGPLLQLTQAMDAGVFEPIAGIIYQNFVASAVAGRSSFPSMSSAMDGASGISPAKRAQVEAQVDDSIIGEALNFPYPALFGDVDVPDLGEDFRAPFETDVPALVFTGTLDGRTFPEAHAEVMAQFSDVHQVVVKNGGHNLFMIDPMVTEIILDFFADEEIEATLIEVDPPNFN